MSEKRETDLRRLQDRLLDRITTAEDQAERAVAGCERLRAQRDALLTLLGRIRAWDMMDAVADGQHWKREIDAAIKAVGEGK